MKKILALYLIVASNTNLFAQLPKYRLEISMLTIDKYPELINQPSVEFANRLSIQKYWSKHFIGSIGIHYSINNVKDYCTNCIDGYNGKAKIKNYGAFAGLQIYKNLKSPKILKPYLQFNLQHHIYKLNGIYSGGLNPNIVFETYADKKILSAHIAFGFDCNFGNRLVFSIANGMQWQVYNYTPLFTYAKNHNYFSSDFKFAYKIKKNATKANKDKLKK
jgi:hypothetical protein